MQPCFIKYIFSPQITIVLGFFETILTIFHKIFAKILYRKVKKKKTIWNCKPIYYLLSIAIQIYN